MRSINTEFEKLQPTPVAQIHEKSNLFSFLQVMELQNTLDDLTNRVDSVKEENLKLRSENSVLSQYIENLMQASAVFQAVTGGGGGGTGGVVGVKGAVGRPGSSSSSGTSLSSPLSCTNLGSVIRCTAKARSSQHAAAAGTASAASSPASALAAVVSSNSPSPSSSSSSVSTVLVAAKLRQ